MSNLRALTEVRSDGIIRFLDIRPGWGDKNPVVRKQRGIHGAELIFGVQRGKLAVEWRLMCPFYLPWVREGLNGLPLSYRHEFSGLGDILTHSPVALREGQERDCSDCVYTGGACFGGGSSADSTKLFDTMVEFGQEAVWKELESCLARQEERVKEQEELERNYT